jgi:hypothetical protein
MDAFFALSFFLRLALASASLYANSMQVNPTKKKKKIARVLFGTRTRKVA